MVKLSKNLNKHFYLREEVLGEFEEIQTERRQNDKGKYEHISLSY